MGAGGTGIGRPRRAGACFPAEATPGLPPPVPASLPCPQCGGNIRFPQSRAITEQLEQQLPRPSGPVDGCQQAPPLPYSPPRPDQLGRWRPRWGGACGGATGHVEGAGRRMELGGGGGLEWPWALPHAGPTCCWRALDPMQSLQQEYLLGRSSGCKGREGLAAGASSLMHSWRCCCCCCCLCCCRL